MFKSPLDVQSCFDSIPSDIKSGSPYVPLAFLTFPLSSSVIAMGFPSFIYRQLFVHPPQIPSNISVKEQVILLTSANSSIGLEAARQCVRLGVALVIFAVRSLPKGEAAKADVLTTNARSETKVEVWHLDIESYDSVLAFGKRVQERPRLDIAMLNAACFKYEFETSPSTRNESSLQVNRAHVPVDQLNELLDGLK
jgi:hypothetical protein